MKLVTVAEMRAMEHAAIAAGSSEAQLMEAAGLAAAQEAWMLLGTLEGRQILVLAGPGNNGDDGLVAARHLHDWGAEVAVAAPREREEDEHLRELQARGVEVAQGAEAVLGRAEVADLVIDALLGVGKARPLAVDEPIGAALAALAKARARERPPKLLAVDLPTGLDADGGGADPLTVAADVTVTFGLPKVGMYQAAGSAVVGRVQVVDIGIPAEAMEQASLELITSRWAQEALPPRPEDANKGTFGKVLIVGGSARYRGAPALAAAAAYRAGAGLVTIACPELVIASIAPSLAEVTWLPQAAAADGGLAGEAAPALRGEWAAFNAAVVGPGLGHTDETRALVWALLPDLAQDLGGRAVIDADALNVLAALADSAERTPAGVVLTPHPGEMARLLGVERGGGAGESRGGGARGGGALRRRGGAQGGAHGGGGGGTRAHLAVRQPAAGDGGERRRTRGDDRGLPGAGPERVRRRQSGRVPACSSRRGVARGVRRERPAGGGDCNTAAGRHPGDRGTLMYSDDQAVSRSEHA